MATKAKKPAAKSAKAEKAPAPAKAEKKAGKAAKAAAAPAERADEDEAVAAGPAEGAGPNTEDLEEQEEAAEEAAAKSSGNSNAAALAAAAGSTEMSASFKNFRHHPDMENFYRFIFENDLRHEALAILDKIMIDKKAAKTAPKGGKAAH